jgi:hypothetical protein
LFDWALRSSIVNVCIPVPRGVVSDDWLVNQSTSSTTTLFQRTSILSIGSVISIIYIFFVDVVQSLRWFSLDGSCISSEISTGKDSLELDVSISLRSAIEHIDLIHFIPPVHSPRHSLPFPILL